VAASCDIARERKESCDQLMKNRNEDGLQTGALVSDAEKSTGKQESLNQVLLKFPKTQHNEILDFIRQLNGDGMRFSTVKDGGTVVEGILLTTSPYEWVIRKLDAFCHERLLHCDLESRGPHLSVATLGDRNHRRIGELQLFTSPYGDFAGIKFPI
jgi:hypothetical protein